MFSISTCLYIQKNIYSCIYISYLVIISQALLSLGVDGDVGRYPKSLFSLIYLKEVSLPRGSPDGK